jgi:hypothetical protein
MGFIAVLKVVGKDLSHAVPWIDDALKIAGVITGVVDPPLAPVFGALDAIFEKLTNAALQAAASKNVNTAEVVTAATNAFTADQLESLVKAVVTMHVINTSLPK